MCLYCLITVQQTTKLRVYTDAKCPFCVWARGLVELRDTHAQIVFLDYNDVALAAETPYSFKDLAAEMHVCTEDGSWFAGYWGWVEILRTLPGYKWLAVVASLPVLRWIGPVAYRFVAARRYRIPAWVLQKLRIPPPCDAGCRIESKF
jgi:predicted DCC family thiol-disulfide oxidoreductase YuxK